MIRYFFTVVFCLVVGFSFGQTDGDYQTRTGATDWNVPTSWQVRTGGTWVNLEDALAAPYQNVIPTNASGLITILNGHTITLSSGSLNIDQTTIDLGGTLVISGSTLNVRNGAGIDLVVSGTLSLTSNGAVSIQFTPPPAFATIQVNGTVNNDGSFSGASASRLTFNSGAIYNHQNSSPPGVIPLATWNAGSLCRITGNVADVPANLNQNFGSFEWNTPLLTVGFLDLNGALVSVAGDLSFINTGATIVGLTLDNPFVLNIGGSLNIGALSQVSISSGANVTINIGTGSGGGNFNFQSSAFVSSYDIGTVTFNVNKDLINNVNGNVNLIAGTFETSQSSGLTNLNIEGNFTNTAASLIRTVGSTSQVNLIFSESGNHTFSSTFVPSFPVNHLVPTVGSNLIVAPNSFLAGPGNLTLGANTSLTLLSLDATGAYRVNTGFGNVRVSGSRSFDPLATIVYAGAAQQFMSSDHPGNVNTRINNTNDVSIVGDVTFTTGILELDNGVLKIDDGNLALPNPILTVAAVSQAGGFIGINSGSNLVVNGSGNFDVSGNLVLWHLAGVSMNNLTINRSGGGYVGQGTAQLDILGTLTLTQGEFHLSSNITRLYGPLVQGTGFMSSTEFSTLEIRGSGAIPADITIAGGEIGTLRMQRNLTFNTTSTLEIGTLILSDGIVNPSTTLSMADGGLIDRTFGSLSAPIGDNGTYSLRYGGINGAFTPGVELPVLPDRAGVLDNFTVDNEFNVTNPNPGPGPQSHTLTLALPLDVGGDLIIIEGIINTGNNAISIGGDINISAIGSIVPGTSTFTFDGGGPQIISSSAPLNLTNVVVNQSASSTVTLSSVMNISNSFAVNSVSTVDVGTNLLTLLSDATTTAFVPEMPNLASIVGTVIVQRHLPNFNSSRAYRYLAPATTNSTVADWQADFPITGTFSNPSTGTGIISGNPSLYRYNESLVTGAASISAGYVNYPASGNSAAAGLNRGEGYAVFVRTSGDYTYDTRGTLGQQGLLKAVSNSGGTNSGWNLVGNPYPAPIVWDDVMDNVLTTGLFDGIYFTDNTLNGGGVVNVAYVNGVSNVPNFDGVIAQGQGFWVWTPSGGQINFEENQKAATGGAQFLREGDIPNVLRLKMKHQNTVDDIVLRLHEEATNEFDKKFDAFKFGASGLYVSFLSKDNDKLAINSVSNAACDNTVRLQIDGAVNGNYTFDFTGIETFNGEVALFLFDKVLNKQIDLASTTQYAFSVSDVSTLKDRFELVIDGPSVETDLTLVGESVCETNPTAYVTLENSQVNVKYTAEWNGQIISTETEGNGGTLQIPVSVAGLPHGENEVNIAAKMFTCDAVPLANKAILSIFKKGVIEKVENGSACEAGTVLLKAVSTEATAYNWYEDEGDVNAIAGQNKAEFTTPALDKSKTYYVAAVNANGCEGARVAVRADVTQLEEVTIEAEGAVLTSSYDTGNQWYLDGLAIENGTSKEIEALSSGVYTVEVTVNGCKSISQGREMNITGAEESVAAGIQVFPNPTTEKVSVQVRSANSVTAQLISTTGVSLNKISLEGEGEIKEGTFDLMQFPVGMYMIRIQDSGKVYIKKISKIK